MLKKLLALFLMLNLPLFLISQTSKMPEIIVTDSVTIGTNFINHSLITGKKYQFSKNVYKFVYDTASGYLITVLRGLSRNGKYYNTKGKIITYSIRKNRLKWWIDFTFQNSDIYFFRNKVFLYEFKKTYLLGLDNGSRLWKTRNRLYYGDNKFNIGIGYPDKNSTKASNTLHGVDLSTGVDLWERYIPRNYGWNDVLTLNDSMILIVAKGLYTVNLKTGKGWDYEASTGMDDYTGMILTNIAGAVVGVLSGMYFYNTGHNIVTGIASNVVEDSVGFYFVSKKKIAKIDKKNGHPIWTTPLEKEFAGKSEIFITDSILYVIGFGYGFSYGNSVSTGIPYFAAFNKNTGEKIFFNLTAQKKKVVFDAVADENSITLLFNKRMVRYRLGDGSVIVDKSLINSAYGVFSQFISSSVFIQNGDSTFISLVKTDTGNMFVYSDDKMIYEIDSTLNVVDSTAYDSIYLKYFEKKEFSFIRNNEKTIILDKNFKEIAEINLAKPLHFFGDKIFIREKSNNKKIKGENSIIEVRWQ